MSAVVKLALVSTIAPASADVHWSSPYYAIRRAFEQTPHSGAVLTEDLDEADVLLVCPRLKNPVFPSEIIFNRTLRKHWNKICIFSTDDCPLALFPGFYTSLSVESERLRLMEGGFYPQVAFDNLLELRDTQPPSLLFGFRGDAGTSPIRGRLIHLANNEWQGLQKDRGFRFECVNIKSPEVDGAVTMDFYRAGYLASLHAARFILCPRGKAPNSIRLYEAMRVGRVPVVICDDWVAPKNVPWSDFIVHIPERLIDKIPEILLSESPTYAERASMARRVWEHYFAASSISSTIVCAVSRIQCERKSSRQRVLFWSFLFRQIVSWRFLRRGVLSEVKRFATTKRLSAQ